MATVTDIGVENKSGEEVTNARVAIGGRVCAIGVVGPTFLAIYTQYPHAATSRAELMWDWPNKKDNREEFDIGKLGPRRAGLVKFVIHANKAKVVFVPYGS